MSLATPRSEHPDIATADAEPQPGPARRIGPDWAAVILAAILVLPAALGMLPSIPFLIK